jgi:4-amino-4-deoxy-L-arabinose transferase-like glycosyltransferase
MASGSTLTCRMAGVRAWGGRGGVAPGTTMTVPAKGRDMMHDRIARKADRERSAAVAGFSSSLVLALLAAAVLRLALSGASPVLDPTEGRYAAIAQEMAVTDDWVTPRVWVNGEHVPFLGKPPLFFWSAALSTKILGANEFAVRLPSFAAGAALLILMYVVLSRYVARRVATSAAFMTVTSFVFFFLSGSVVLDMELMFFVAGALTAYLAFVLEPDTRARKRWSLLIFLLLAGGFLTKGPVALILFGLPVFLWTVWRRKWRLLTQHAWWIGVPLFAALVVPWFALAAARNPGFLRYFFVNENLLRYLAPNYGDLYGTGHPYPHGSALVMFVLSALPWSLVAVWLTVKKRWAWFAEMLHDDVQSFLFFGFTANVVFWCFAHQLLLTYMTPMVPMLTGWIAVTLCNAEDSSRRAARLALATCVVWFAVLVVSIPALASDSTRGILSEAGRVASELNIPDRVTFTHRTPQSAFFYAPNRIENHPTELAEVTIRRALEPGEPRLLAVRRDQVDSVPADLLDRLLLVGSSDGWLLYVTHAG